VLFFCSVPDTTREFFNVIFLKVVKVVFVRSVERLQARWSDDLRRAAGGSWMRVAEDRARWRTIGEAYVQHWTWWADDDILFNLFY
jgi:hypothetical protein